MSAAEDLTRLLEVSIVLEIALFEVGLSEEAPLGAAVVEGAVPDLEEHLSRAVRAALHQFRDHVKVERHRIGMISPDRLKVLLGGLLDACLQPGAEDLGSGPLPRPGRIQLRVVGDRWQSEHFVQLVVGRFVGHIRKAVAAARRRQRAVLQ